jgi:hypothetical protein
MCEEKEATERRNSCDLLTRRHHHRRRPGRVVRPTVHQRDWEITHVVLGLLIFVSLLVGSGLLLIWLALLLAQGLPFVTEHLADLAWVESARCDT